MRVVGPIVVVAALALGGCASGGSPSERAPDAVSPWGDRTVAMTYKDGDPLVAYFAPGQGEGRISVWDGGESAIVRGDWRREGGRICMTLDVFRRESASRPPLRSRAPVCLGENDARLDARAYQGDVFGLRGLDDAPYILSQADNERLVTVLHDAKRVRS